ncbi:MAG: SPOR domain-containing protein [Candidatus Azotimanducaceae bacterium]
MKNLIFLLVFLFSGCSSLQTLWPFGKDKDNCLETNSCESAAEVTRAASETWSCNGTSKSEGWKCARSSAPNFSDKRSSQDISSISAYKIDLVQKLSLFLDSGFAVQIAALQSIEEITKLAERIGIETPLIAETKLEGASWFVLVLDLYEEFESAQTASKNLQRAYPFLNEPWVRPVKSLKKSLAKFSG